MKISSRIELTSRFLSFYRIFSCSEGKSGHGFIKGDLAVPIRVSFVAVSKIKKLERRTEPHGSVTQ